MSILDLIPQTEKETLKFRLLALMVVALAFLYEGRDVHFIPILGLVGGYLVYSVLLRVLLIPRFTSYALLGAMLVCDVGTIIAALHIISLDSPIFGLLPVVVVYYSVYLGYSGGISAAIVSTVGYTSLVFGTGQADEMKNILGFQPIFYILAMLVGYISQKRLTETQERQSLQQMISAEAGARSLLEIARGMGQVVDPDTVSTDMARIGALVARVPVCAVFIHDPDTDALVYQASNVSGRLTENAEKGVLSQPIGQASFLSEAWTSGSVSSLNGLSENGQSGGADGVYGWLQEIHARGAIACPLTNLQGEKIGVMCFVTTDDISAFDEETLEAVRSFSPTAGRFIASTQAYSQAERRSRRVASELEQSIEAAGRFREMAQRKNMRFGPLLIEPGRESVRWQDNTVRLTKTEFDLLYALADKSGSVVNQDTLVREVWGRDFVPQGKVVDVTVHRLRRKLASLPEGRKLIRTVRGQGYIFAPPERFVSPP